MRRIARIVLLCASGVLFAAALLLTGSKYAIEATASSRARDFIGEAAGDKAGDAKLALRLARLVHGKFQASGFETRSLPLLVRLRPYLTHSLLPAFARVEPGAVEMIYLDGFCDEAARTLQFLLREAGLDAWQLNIVAPDDGHSVAVAVTRDGAELFLDPHRGVVPVRDGKPLSADEARALARSARSGELEWMALAPTADAGRYGSFAQAVFSRQGEPLAIRVDVSLPAGGRIELGRANGDSADVKSAGLRERLTPYWNYLGSRYDRAWERIFRFEQRTRVTFVLTSDADRRVLTADRESTVDGRRVIYELAAGDTLHLRDGLARRDYLRLRSYQDVDYVWIEAIAD